MKCRIGLRSICLSRARSRAIITRLLDAGADPADANQRVILGLQASAEEALAEFTPDQFQQLCSRKFGIYNDVFVHKGNGTIAVYGYPESECPPTDFHTATLVGDFIYVIGSLGYLGTRRHGETPVYRLNVHTLRMDRLHASGDAPGWIFRHRAVAVPPLGIRVWGGKVALAGDDVELTEQNFGSYILDLDRLR